MSTPFEIFSNKLTGVPTPIKYLGLSGGKIEQTKSETLYISSSGSPTDKPPIAYPLANLPETNSVDSFRRSL